MLTMVLGLIIFLGVHALPMNAELRDGLANRFGANAYKMGFAVVSLVGFALIVYGYYKLQIHPGKNPQIWDPPLWMRHITLLLMIPAMIMLVAAYIPSRIRTVLKHPMLLAIKTWALAHLLANGDLASMVLFGSFLAYAVLDFRSAKKRQAKGPLGEKTGGLLHDIGVVAVGLLLYVSFVLWGHKLLIGVPVVAI